MTSFEQAEATPASNDVDADLIERLSVLDTLTSRPLSEHPDVYQQLHADLQATLAEIDGA
jgi:hypothetical protein